MVFWTFFFKAEKKYSNRCFELQYRKNSTLEEDFWNPQTKPRASPQRIQIWIIAMFCCSISFSLSFHLYISVCLADWHVIWCQANSKGQFLVRLRSWTACKKYIVPHPWHLSKMASFQSLSLYLFSGRTTSYICPTYHYSESCLLLQYFFTLPPHTPFSLKHLSCLL